MKKLYIAHRKKVFVCLLILAAAALGFAGGRQSMEEEIPPVPSSRTILELRENAGMIELYGLDCDMVSLAGPSSLYMANLRFVEPLRGERTEASATLDEASGHITVSITMDRGAGGAHPEQPAGHAPGLHGFVLSCIFPYLFTEQEGFRENIAVSRIFPGIFFCFDRRA